MRAPVQALSDHTSLEARLPVGVAAVIACVVLLSAGSVALPLVAGMLRRSKGGPAAAAAAGDGARGGAAHVVALGRLSIQEPLLPDSDE